MRWLFGTAGLAAVVLALDRLVEWRARRGHRRPERWDGRTTGAFGAFGEFIEVFHPSYHHVVEERERRRLEADRPESAAPPFGIDLDAGRRGSPCRAHQARPMAGARPVASSPRRANPLVRLDPYCDTILTANLLL